MTLRPRQRASGKGKQRAGFGWRKCASGRRGDSAQGSGSNNWGDWEKQNKERDNAVTGRILKKTLKGKKQRTSKKK